MLLHQIPVRYQEDNYFLHKYKYYTSIHHPFMTCMSTYLAEMPNHHQTGVINISVDSNSN